MPTGETKPQEVYWDGRAPWFHVRTATGWEYIEAQTVKQAFTILRKRLIRKAFGGSSANAT